MKRFGATFCLIAALAWHAAAQDAAPVPTPAPAAGAGQDGLPDIESLRPVGSSANLIPGLAVPVPAGEMPSGGGGRRRGKASGGAGVRSGSRPRGNRSQDVLAARAGEDPLAVRVAYRRDEAAVLRRDPELAGLPQRAETADTDPEKRALLKEYYARLFASVRGLDPSPAMRQHVQLLSQIASQRYDPQRRAVGGEEDLVRGQGGGGKRGRGR